MLVFLNDPDDPRLAPYRDVRERDLVGREGLFVAEGEVVLRGLVASQTHRPVSVLIVEKRLAKLEPMLAALPDDVPVYVASQAGMDAVVGFPIHRGILALGARAEPVSPDALLATLPERALVVAGFGLANHDNVGGVFRAAAAFGADAVLLDSESGDPLYRKAIRVSVGAALTVPFARIEEGEDAVALFERLGFVPFALTPGGDTLLSQVRRPPRAAVLLGAEGPGLPQAIIARCRAVRIPMATGFDSLNVAVAGAVALHHLAFAAAEESAENTAWPDET